MLFEDLLVKKMRVALIWAMSRNRVIGKDNRLPWHLPHDLRHFKQCTLGSTLIMGRRTFESMDAKPLPARHNVVLTKRPADWPEPVQIARTLPEALEFAQAQCERDAMARCFIVGGSSVYAAGFDVADELFVTEVDAVIDGDVFFPEYDATAWRCVQREEVASDDRHAYAFTISRFERAH